MGAFEVDGLVKQRKELDAILASNPEMEKKLQGLIRKVLLEVRRNLSSSARGEMSSDPRQAYKAIRTTVYRQILGGNVNILSKKRRSGGGGSYQPPRNPSRRGGNRRARSQRTQSIESYWGADRGFILRFLNAGTQGRTIQFTGNPARENINRGSRGGNVSKYGKTTNTGNRGRITPRNFFGQRSQAEMEKGAEMLTTLIEDLIQKEFNK